jgi:hypothetical protein
MISHHNLYSTSPFGGNLSNSVTNPYDSPIGSAGASPWTSAAGVIYPATITDDVAIGSSSLSGAANEHLFIKDTVESGLSTGAYILLEKNASDVKGAWNGVYVQMDHTGASGVAGAYTGFWSDNNWGAAQTLSSSRGFISQLDVASGGTVTSYVAFQAESTTGAGTIGTAYGVLIGTMNGSTNSYGIYQTSSSDRNVFFGDVVIGAATMSGTELLRVVGDARVEGKLTVTGTIDPTDIVLDEQSDHPTAPAAGKGIIWVRDDSPNVLVFTDDAGTDTVLGAGGGSSPWTSAAGVVYPSTLTDKVAIGSSSLFGVENLYVFENATSGALEGIRVEMEHTSGGAVTQFTGVTVALDQQSGAGGMNAFTSFDGTLAHQSATTFGTIKNYLASLTITDASGAVDDYYAFHAEVVGGSGTINNNAYGIYIGQMEQGGTTNAYGVYQASTADSNYFAGQTSYGSTSPPSTPRLYVEVDDGDGYTRGVSSQFIKNGTTGTQGFINFYGDVSHTGNQAGTSNYGVIIHHTFSPSASQTLLNMIGFESQPETGSNANVTNIIGFRATTDELDGAITNWYSFKAEQPNTVGTGITNSYGVYIDDQDGNTLSYGIYQAAATDSNYFAGSVGINQTTVSSTNYLEIVDTDDTTTKVGVQVSVPKDGTGNNKAATGFDCNFTHSGTGSALAYYGHRMDVNVTAAATVSTVAGFYSDCVNNGATAITNYYGVNVRSVVNSGTTTNAYGVYIQGMEATNRWGIYQTASQDTNYFAGQVGIGTNAPDSACELEVADSTVSGQRRNIYVDYDMSGTASSLVWHGIEVDCDYTGTGGGTLRGISTEIIVNPSGTTTIPTIDCYYAVASLNNAALTVTNYACYRAGIGGASATVTNAYGLYIGTMDLGTGNSWGVYQTNAGDDNYFNGRVGIGTNSPATSAALEISSTTRALLVSRMTTTERNALTAVNGMIIYNTTTNAFNFYENGAWVTGSGLA